MTKRRRQNEKPNDERCLLCGQTGKLVDSHIVPRSFFPLKGGDGKLLRTTGDEPPKRAPKGVYDQIVCEGCERSFSEADDYAARLLKGLQPGETPPFVEFEVDYVLLKRFILSLLWRAAASKQRLYASVTLGPLAERLAELVRINDPGEVDEFAFYIARIIEVDVGVIKPVRRRFNYEGGYRNLMLFAFGSVAIYVKTDHRPMPGVLNDLILRPGRPLVIPAVSLAALHLEKPIFDMVRNNPNAFPKSNP